MAIQQLVDEAHKATDANVAEEKMQQAVALAHAGKEEYLAATIQNNWGVFLASHGRTKEAIPYAQNALKLFREQNRDGWCAWAEGLLSSIYGNQNNMQQAVLYVRSALQDAIRGKLPETNIYNFLYAMEIAEKEAADKGLHFQGAPDTKRFEDYQHLAETAGFPIIAAILETRVAASAADSGNRREALRLYSNALPILQQNPAPYAQMIAGKTAAAIGLIYLDWGLADESLPWFEEADSLARGLAQKGNPSAILVLAQALGSKGVAYALLQRNEEAKKALEEAIPWNQKTGFLPAILSLESLLSRLKQSIDLHAVDPQILQQKADAVQEQAEQLLAQPDPGDNALLKSSLELMGIGWRLYDQSKFPQAQKVLMLAWQTWKRIKDNFPPGTYLIAILDGLGRTEMELKHYPASETYLTQAMELQETLARSIPSKEQQQQQSPLHVNAYHSLAMLRQRQGRATDALTCVERGRAQSLSAQLERLTALNILGPEESKTFFHCSRALLETKSPSISAMLAYNKEVEKLRKSGKLPDFSPQSLNATDVDHLTQRYPHTLFLEWVLLDANTVQLIAFGSKDRAVSYIWNVPRNALTLNKDWLGPGRIDPAPTEISTRWMQAIANTRPSEPQMATQMYSLLFGELGKRTQMLTPKRYTHLALVMDGEMANLPFAALRDTKGTRLLDRYVISMPVSLKLLVKPHPAPTAKVNALIVADPKRSDMPPLPEARRGAEKVARLFPGSRLLESEQATLATTLKAIKAPELLVFATHGKVRNLNPSLLLASHIATRKGSPSERDELEAWQVSLVPVHARLTVLWGCETGLGRAVGSEGTSGFVWAFHAAGCQAVVCSQWDVSETAASELMKEFHTALSQGTDADQALTSAMKTVQKDFPQPCDWAPFQIYGSPARLLAIPKDGRH